MPGFFMWVLGIKLCYSKQSWIRHCLRGLSHVLIKLYAERWMGCKLLSSGKHHTVTFLTHGHPHHLHLGHRQEQEHRDNLTLPACTQLDFSPTPLHDTCIPKEPEENMLNPSPKRVRLSSRHTGPSRLQRIPSSLCPLHPKPRWDRGDGF